MSGYRAVLLVLFVVGGSLTAAPVTATVDASVDSAETHRLPAGVQQSDAANDSANQSLGADISSFMQSNAAEADGAIETGMWAAVFDATENRSRQQRLVERRTDELRTELSDLQNRKQELLAEREAGNVSEAAYKARIGELIGRINALKSAINVTERRAQQVDTNVDAVQLLEAEANNLSGPEIAAVARNTTGLGNGSGPPADVGNGNETPLGDADDGVDDPTNETPGGPPGDVENGNATDPPETDGGDQSGPPDEGGPSNGDGPGDDRGQSDGAPGPESPPVEGALSLVNPPTEGVTASVGASTTDAFGYETLGTSMRLSGAGLARAPQVA